MQADDVSDKISNSVDLDGISLAQALIDVEVANARVIDLTRRLTEQNRQLAVVRHEVESLRLHHADAAAQLAALTSSNTYRVVHLANRARRLLKR